MYNSYWINKNTGQLLRCSHPSDEPKDNPGWERINETTYFMYVRIANFAVAHARNK